MKRILGNRSRAQPRNLSACGMGWLGGCLLELLLLSSVAAQEQIATEAWVRRYNSAEIAADGYARTIVTDIDGNVIVVGSTANGTTGDDMVIIKYSGVGLPLWTNRFNGIESGDESANDVA